MLSTPLRPPHTHSTDTHTPLQSGQPGRRNGHHRPPDSGGGARRRAAAAVHPRLTAPAHPSPRPRGDGAAGARGGVRGPQIWCGAPRRFAGSAPAAAPAQARAAPAAPGRGGGRRGRVADAAAGWTSVVQRRLARLAPLAPNACWLAGLLAAALLHGATRLAWTHPRRQPSKAGKELPAEWPGACWPPRRRPPLRGAAALAQSSAAAAGEWGTAEPPGVSGRNFSYG